MHPGKAKCVSCNKIIAIGISFIVPIVVLAFLNIFGVKQSFYLNYYFIFY